MKHVIATYVASVAVCLFIASGCTAQPVLVRDGQPVARIYTVGPVGDLPDRAGDDVVARHTAHSELIYHIEKMSGATLEVVVTDDPAAIEGPAIVLGDLARQLGAEPDPSGYEEGFRLLTVEDKLLIAGESDQATLYGVYECLRTLGCDWIMPGEIGEIIPRRTTIALPVVDQSHTPDFPYRRLWYRGGSRFNTPDDYARFAQWCRRHKMGIGRGVPPLAGGHVWDTFIRRHKAEFDKDPTMLALVRMPDGTMQRRGPQLESTHPRVIELFAEEIKATFEKNGWAKDRMAGFGIGPADGLGYSESIETQLASAGRIDPITGDPDVTDLLILLGNDILEKLGDEYPNVYLSWYLYSVHSDYPARYKPHPRTGIIFAPIMYSRFHGFLDTNSKTRPYYRDVVDQWLRLSREQGNPLLFRGYNWNLAENIAPFTRLRMWGEDIPYYKQGEILGFNVEATKSWTVNGPHDYLYARMIWDASLDWRDVVREYCEKSFGKGAEPMRRYLLRLVETQHAAGQEAGSYHAVHLIFDDAFVKRGEADIAEALRRADTDADRTRIGYIQHALTALKLYLAYHETSLTYDFAAMQQRYDAMLAHWQEAYDTDTQLVGVEVPQYLKRFIASYVTEGAKYSTDPYRIIFKVPDALPTMFDEQGEGHRMGFASPDLNDESFVRTRTWSTTWDAQGLSNLRNTAVWYRIHFTVPADAADQPVGLFLGGFEDEARVWINGQAVGTSGRRFSMPAVFDLTDGVRYDGDNVAAVQIIRNSKANELGLGGLIRPSFIFTGPRLETKAPAPLKLQRVLPGGELADE